MDEIHRMCYIYIHISCECLPFVLVILLVGEEESGLFQKCDVFKGEVRDDVNSKSNLNLVEQERVEDKLVALFSNVKEMTKSYIPWFHARVVDFPRKPISLTIMWNSKGCPMSLLSSMCERMLWMVIPYPSPDHWWYGCTCQTDSAQP